MERTENFSLATQCMDFCQQLSSKGMTFTFALSMGPLYHFSLDTKEKPIPSLGVGKVKKSPSTLKRNAKRREDFLLKKSEPTPATLSSEDNSSHSSALRQAATSDTVIENPANLEDTSKQKNDFKCEICNYANQSEKRLKTHIARKHMEYQCELCTFAGLTFVELLDHMEKDHTVQLKKHLSNKKKDIRTVHEEKEIKCDQCVFKAKDVQSIVFHIRTEHKEK